MHCVIPPPPPLSAGGLNLQPNFQKDLNLTGPQLLEGNCFFQGNVAIFTLKIN